MFQTMSQLGDTLKGVVEISDGAVKVIAPKHVRGALIDHLITTAVFHEKADLRGTCRWIIKMIAPQLDIHLCSIQPLYNAMGRGQCDRFTVPAVNVRGMAYDTARALFRAARSNRVGAFILEIAKSEMVYTDQSPAEYVAVIIAAAIQEGFSGPLFIQGDHFQANMKRFRENRQKEVASLRTLIQQAITAGFFNIDLDSSTLVDLSVPDVVEQQRNNFEVAADLTAYIRSLEPQGITISVGGEIGEVGNKNSTVEEFTVYMEGYLNVLRQDVPTLCGISKISVQTGTSHGGIPMSDGTIAKVQLDFDVLEKISNTARQVYGLAGAVQHGASTLPMNLFDRFPETGTAEIHLATEFQNMLYDRLPHDFKQTIYAYLRKECKDEMKEGQTDEQFIYKTRKKALGPFKQALWNLPEEVRRPIGDALEEKFVMLFKKLNVWNTRSVVDKIVQPFPVSFVLRNEIESAYAETKKSPQVKADTNSLAD